MEDSPKPKSLAIDAKLHHYLKLIAAAEVTQINKVTEPALWKVVSANREILERMTGKPVTIPEQIAA